MRLCSRRTRPSRIGIHRCIAGDVDDAGAFLEPGPHALQQPDLSDDVRFEDVAKRVERKVQDWRKRAGAECAGVVDDSIDAGVAAGQYGQGIAVLRIGNIAGEAGNVSYLGEFVPDAPKSIGMASGDDEVPSTVGECSGEGGAEAAGRSGDDGSLSGVVIGHDGGSLAWLVE